MSLGTSCILQIHGDTINFASFGWTNQSSGYSIERDARGSVTSLTVALQVLPVSHNLWFHHSNRLTLWFYQEAISEYQGTVITVSHDRYFIKQIVNRVVEVKDGDLQDYAGDYNVSTASLLKYLVAVHKSKVSSNWHCIMFGIGKFVVLFREEPWSQREGARAGGRAWG